MNKIHQILSILNDHLELCQVILDNEKIVQQILTISKLMTESLSRKGKILFCGNGGSAADSQHLAAELTGKFLKEREPINAEALHVNSSYLTAVSNDYSFEEVYSRAVKAKASKGDVLIAISTSGNSRNVLNAVDTANQMGLITIGFTGRNGGQMNENCRILLKIPSDETPRIQEAHIILGHIIIQLVEENLFPGKT